ncbi:hypothetical protein ACFV1N_10720 [Streptosporangium canum]|uniref:hypothetical protein n=1 Tax=Streptosporangium canum TaxID=324952 RepID=UPI0036BFF3CA
MDKRMRGHPPEIPDEHDRDGPGLPESPDDYFFDYDAPQDPDYFEVGDYLPHTLYISENVEGSVYPLNPHILASGDEQEARYLDTTYMLGAIRFRSFWYPTEDAFRRYTS